MELAIDTSTNFAGIALSDKGMTIAELEWFTEQNHTVELVPNITRLFNQARMETTSLTTIFVAIGPGSFNGLRVGISTAKGLALTLVIPIVAVGTLEIEAYPFSFTGLPVCPIHNAGRGEIATAVYRKDDNWHCLEAEHITTVDDLCGKIKERTVFCGEIPQSAEEQLRAYLGDLAVIPDRVVRIRHASYLVELGWQRCEQGKYDDLARLQPLYLRQPPITQPKHKYTMVRKE